jgi:hypothetical protein
MTWSWGHTRVRRLVIRSRPPGAGTPDHPGVPRRTSEPVGTAMASQVTPPHARASGAAALPRWPVRCDDEARAQRCDRRHGAG